MTNEELAVVTARQTYIKTLNVFGGTDAGFGFISLKTNLESLYLEYNNNPTDELAKALGKIQAAFKLLEKLAEV